jgi:hypothetical protein
LIDRAGRFLTVGIIWLLIVFGCYFFTLARPEKGTKWEQLPTLPERATSIELNRFGYVRAYAESGSSYMAYLYSWQDEPWMPYDAEKEGVYGEPCEVNGSSRFNPSSPPGDVISRSSADCFASAENQFHAEVVLLEKNEAWVWTHLYGGVGDAFTSLLVLAAGALGVVLLLIGGVMKLYDG